MQKIISQPKTDVLREQNAKESKSREQIISNQRAEYDKGLEKIDRLIDLRAAGEITAEEFSERKRFLTAEKGRLEGFLATAVARADEWLDTADRYFDFATHAKIRFEKGPLEVKRSILQALGSNLFLKDRILSVSLAKPLTLIEKAAPIARAIEQRFEPLKNVEKQGHLSDLYSQNPDLLRTWDNVRLAILEE